MYFQSIVLILLFSFSAFANFIPESKVGLNENLTVFMKQDKCESHHGESCIRIPTGYDKDIHELADEMIDDLEKPKFKKADLESCLDAENCQAVLELKACSDASLTPIINGLEVYCPEPNGYEKKMSGRKIVKENEVKKAEKEALKQAEKAEKESKKAAIQKIKDKLSSKQKLNDSEIEEALEFLLK